MRRGRQRRRRRNLALSLNLLGATPSELVATLQAAGVRADASEARRVLARIVAEAADDPAPRRPVRRIVLDAVRATCTWDRPTLLHVIDDPDDGAVRLLMRAADGATFESVLIRLHRPGAWSLCLSSQAGCAMACRFCATGSLGLRRSLEAHEIVGQLLVAREVLNARGGRVTGAVFMGQGEPFHAYDAVIGAAGVLSSPVGARIAAEAISVSTVGLVPQMRRFTAEGHRHRLVVSLTSAVPERRAALLPVAGRTPLAEVVAAIAEHARARGPRVTVAWVVLGGVNTGPDEVEALAHHFSGVPIRLNLIDVNGGVGGFERAGPAELEAFRDALAVLGVPVVRRYSVGRSQAAACGMLAGLVPSASLAP